MLTRMNPYRFEALAMWARSSAARFIFSEGAHWSTEDERLLGMVTFDHTDQDYGYIILGRDDLGRYRCIHVNCSYFTRRIAEAAPKGRLIASAALPDEEFHQGDEHGGAVDLFTPVVPTRKLHPNFVEVTTRPHLTPALEIMREMSKVFNDQDGNFVKDFQTTGFNARIWELYLFATLVEQGWALDRSHDRPDFVASIGSNRVCIEAVTVNPTDKSGDEQLLAPNTNYPEDVMTLLTDICR